MLEARVEKGFAVSSSNQWEPSSFFYRGSSNSAEYR